MNSKTAFSKGYKAPLSKRNWPSTQKFLYFAKEYLLSLMSTKSEPLHTTRRKTAILGFVNNVNSIFYLYENYVLNPSCDIHYLSMYKWSQDHLELFFGCIRQCGRFNNNALYANRF